MCGTNVGAIISGWKKCSPNDVMTFDDALYKVTLTLWKHIVLIAAVMLFSGLNG